MIDVYSCKHYLFFLQQFIENQNKENGRGITKRIAMALQCHSTFISQVLKNKSHFSVEQAIRFCKFAKLDSSETEFFLNLLMHAKSSDIDTKEFYSLLLKKQISERQDLTRRWKKWNLKSPEVESLYFGSVLLQLVHAATQIQGKNDFRSMECGEIFVV